MSLPTAPTASIAPSVVSSTSTGSTNSTNSTTNATNVTNDANGTVGGNGTTGTIGTIGTSVTNANNNNNKTAKCRRQDTERLCLESTDHIAAVMKIIPDAHHGEINSRIGELRARLTDFVGDGKIAHSGSVIEAQAAVINELVAAVTTLGAMDASQGPDAKTSRSLALKAATLWVEQRTVFSSMQNVLGQWADKVAEMNAMMQSAAHDLDRTSSMLSM